MKEDSPPVDRFFGVMSPRALWSFFAAVFFIFSPVGLLFSSSIVQRRPVWLVVVLFALSGVIAVCWAGLFTLSRWFIPGVVITSLAMATLSSWASRFDPNRSMAGRFPLWIAVGLIVAGYSLFIAFIGRQGKNTVRLMTEMALAREIHRTLVPAIDFDDGTIQALGASSASSEMGGDLVDVVRGPEHIDFLVADVSGHGVKAGVVMGMIKAAVRTSLRQGAGLEVALGELNEVLEEITSPELYATAVGLRIERRSHLAYIFAGHHYALLWRAGSRSVERLHQRARPLGMLPGQSYHMSHTQLGEGDLLAVYTDGLSEAMDAQERELGHEAIERRVAELADRPLAEIQHGLLALVAAHGQRTDDQTLLLVRRVSLTVHS